MFPLGNTDTGKVQIDFDQLRWLYCLSVALARNLLGTDKI